MKKITKIVFKCVALAMGVATVVLSVFNKLEVNSAITLLAIGLTCLAIDSFDK